MSNDFHQPGHSSPAVMRFFDQAAGRFPEIGGDDSGLWQRSVTALFRRSLRLRFQRVFERIGPLDGCTVLDIGCGTGTYAVRAASGGAARVVGIDLSSEMIRLAKERAIQAKVSNRCEFIASDFFAYQPTEVFDYIVGMGVMDYVAEASSFVTKVSRLIGKAAFISFPKSGGFLAWQRRLRYRDRCPLFLYSGLDLEHLLSELAPKRCRIESVARDWFVTIHGHRE